MVWSEILSVVLYVALVAGVVFACSRLGSGC